MKKIRLFENKTTPKTVGDIIKEYREKCGLSKEDVASFFDNDLDRINSWENNSTEPSITEGKVLSKLFAVSLDEFFDYLDVTPKLSNLTAFEDITHRNRLSNRWYQ